MNIVEITNQLEMDDQGIYRSKGDSVISYPDEGNKDCFLLEDSSFWFKYRNQCITSVIKRYPPSGFVLDIGGGNGYVTRGILDAGFDAVLLEPGIEGAKNGKKHRKIPTVICSTFNEASIKEASLSAIGCFDVIEHIENDKKFIDEVHKKLKSGGLIYATVPAYQWLWSQSDLTAGHYRRYNRSMIAELMSDKFEILYFTYFFSLLVLPVYLLRTLPFRLGLTVTKSMLSNKTEHGTNRGMASRLLSRLLNYEYNKINNESSIRFGSSCMFVARKIDRNK